MDELNLINLRLALEEEKEISKEDLRNILSSMSGYEPKIWLLNFLSTITIRQSQILDLEQSFNYYKIIISEAIQILNLQEYEPEIDLITFMVVSSIAERLIKNTIINEKFSDIIKNILIEKANNYKTNEDDFLFACWYISVIKSLKILLRDFHANNEVIEKLAILANENSERMEGIAFQGKETLIQ